MQLQTLNITALVCAAVWVIAREQTKWIQGVAIVQLLAALLLALLAGKYLRLPFDHVDLLLTAAISLGWCIVLTLANAKATLIAATIAAWGAGLLCLTKLGWIQSGLWRGFLR